MVIKAIDQLTAGQRVARGALVRVRGIGVALLIDVSRITTSCLPVWIYAIFVTDAREQLYGVHRRRD